MPDPSSTRAAIAAVVNGLLVLLGGPLLYMAASSGLPVRAFWRAMAVVAPFALVAAWRTWVHARRRLSSGDDSGWGGVLEAGGLALAVGVWNVAPAFARLGEPPPFMYVAVATVLGLLVGLILLGTAFATLGILSRALDARP